MAACITPGVLHITPLHPHYNMRYCDTNGRCGLQLRTSALLSTEDNQFKTLSNNVQPRIFNFGSLNHKIWRTLKQYPSVLCGSNDNLNSISIISVSVFSNHLLRHRKVAKVSHIPSIIWTHKNPCFNSTKLFVFWSHLVNWSNFMGYL